MFETKQKEARYQYQMGIISVSIGRKVGNKRFNTQNGLTGCRWFDTYEHSSDSHPSNDAMPAACLLAAAPLLPYMFDTRLTCSRATSSSSRTRSSLGTPPDLPPIRKPEAGMECPGMIKGEMTQVRENACGPLAVPLGAPYAYHKTFRRRKSPTRSRTWKIEEHDEHRQTRPLVLCKIEVRKASNQRHGFL